MEIKITINNKNNQLESRNGGEIIALIRLNYKNSNRQGKFIVKQNLIFIPKSIIKI